MIETIGLTKKYGSFLALDQIDLTINERDIFGFIGPNGAGKTTTLRILATLLAPTAGQAKVNGIDVTRKPFEIKRIVGFMPDSFGVYDGMRLREYLDFFGAAYKIPSKKRKGIIDDVLELTDLSSKADDYVSAFSRGMKQRCCLAKTLIHDPQVLLLDEPASGLDPRARIEIRELLKALRDMGKTIFISSHILAELGDMCNRIGIIEHGKILAAGDFREILANVRQVNEIRLVVLDGGDAAARILGQTPGIANVDRSGNEFQMQSNLGREGISELHNRLVGAGVKIVFFEQDKGTLEDVFLHVTKGGL
ncbi:MAG TPA: ABC transporter ATP-binding protein [Candidatus Hydrogenedentes bacterium]|nr:ABC transporter ATP-binding protein [Candidatus Hydrogenedentota bacterium]HIJ73695.1 ABC transporter ATP-binding protein [Candidatus Hydrogenedentota bacterium]